MSMPIIIWEILATALVAIAGNIGGQAMRQASEPGKMAPALLVCIVVLAIGVAIAWFIDPVKTPGDYVFWTLAYCLGFFFGWREKS